MKVFPIYQTTGTKAAYFHKTRGLYDAQNAIRDLSNFGFPEGTTAYFAVDFDASEGEIARNVIPYFTSVSNSFAKYQQGKYSVGVYGPRLVCQKVLDAGYAENCFVSDMSSGYGSNILQPLPAKWAYDQIQTVTLGTGEGKIEIDRDRMSGLAHPVLFDPGALPEMTEALRKMNQEADVLRLLDCLRIPLGSVSFGIEFNREIQVLESPNLEIYFSASLEASVNPDANFQVSVTNGKMDESAFALAWESFTGTVDAGEMKDFIPNFESLAVEMGNGRMEFTFVPRAAEKEFELDVKLIIYAEERTHWDSDFAVTMRYVFKYDGPGPEEIAEDLWEEVVNACTFYQVPAEVKEKELIVAAVILALAFAPQMVPGLQEAGVAFAAIALVVRKALNWLNSKDDTIA